MVWGWFMTVGAIGAKVAAFVTQYLVLQILVRRDLHQLKNETGLKGG